MTTTDAARVRAPLPAPASSRRRLAAWPLRESVVPILLAIEVLSFSLLSKQFLTLSNIDNVILNSVDLALIAAGLTLVIVLGGIDVSTGQALGVVAWCVGRLTLAGWPPLLVIVTAAGLGALMGTVNGIIISRLQVTAIIATLGTAGIWSTVLFALWGGSDLFAPPVTTYASIQRTFGLPTVAFFVLAAFAVLWFVSRYRAYGRHVYAIGNDAEGARLSGINVVRTGIISYAIVGLLVGLAAVVFMARVGVIQASSGGSLSLAAIAAVVVGGTSITGGRGSVVGTLWGVLFIAVLQNGVVLAGVPPLWNGVLVGAFIVIAVAVDVTTDRISAARRRGR